MLLVTKSSPTLCDPMDHSPLGSSVHGILQARILEGLPFPSLGDLSDPGIEPVSPALQTDSLELSHQGSHSVHQWSCNLLGNQMANCLAGGLSENPQPGRLHVS